MRLLGPETADDRELREWFESQERGNIERLEARAQTIACDRTVRRALRGASAE